MRENLLAAWGRFRKGKRHRADVVAFERNLDDAIAELSEDLVRGTYHHHAYHTFMVRDPKVRVIHKATVRDRVVHQAIVDVLSPFWEQRFLPQSYGCRPRKGVHRAIARIVQHVRRASGNGHGPAFVLHGDIARFFSRISHDVLRVLLRRLPIDARFHALCDTVIASHEDALRRGLPLGNLTSQLFGNVVLHELDRFVIHALRHPAYVRYADDFFLVSDNLDSLDALREPISDFLQRQLQLTCSKLAVRRWAHGVDALGVVLFPWGIVPRRRTRIAAQKCTLDIAKQGYTTDGWRRAASYLGMLETTKSFTMREALRVSYA
jgi:RNA-directed DNA polymerase